MSQNSSPLIQRPKRGPKPGLLTEELELFLRLVVRLRVITGEQAHWLFKPFTSADPRNNRSRLNTLVKNGYLDAQLVNPARGAFGALFYRPTFKALVALDLAKSKHLTTFPAEHVLRYLLFRNDVYAAARADGWHIATPVLTPADDQPRYLKLFNDAVFHSMRARVSSLELELGRRDAGVGERSREAELLRAKTQLERALAFKQEFLTFELLVKVDAQRNLTESVLLVIDDPRRAVGFEGAKHSLPDSDVFSKLVCPTCAAPLHRYVHLGSRSIRCAAEGCGYVRLEKRAQGTQVQDLPRALPPSTRLCLRDKDSVYSPAQKRLIATAPHLRAWRKALTERYGADLLKTDTLFPDLWAQKIAPSKAADE